MRANDIFTGLAVVGIVASITGAIGATDGVWSGLGTGTASTWSGTNSASNWSGTGTASTWATSPGLNVFSSPNRTAPAPVTGLSQFSQAIVENRRLTAENGQLRAYVEDLLNWILTNFQGRYPVPERLLDRMDLLAVADDFSVHPDVVEVLRITPDEVVRVNDALSYARAQMDAIESDVLSVSESSTGHAVVEIPVHETEGAEVRDALDASLGDALGTDRFATFVKVAGKDLDRRFIYFGAAKRTITFDALAATEAAPAVMRIHDEVSLADETGARHLEGVEFETAEVPAAYQAYLDQVPEAAEASDEEDTTESAAPAEAASAPTSAADEKQMAGK